MLAGNLALHFEPFESFSEWLSHPGPVEDLTEESSVAFDLLGLERCITLKNSGERKSCLSNLLRLLLGSPSDRENFSQDRLFAKVVEIEIVYFILVADDCVKLGFVAISNIRILGVMIEEVKSDKCLNGIGEGILHAKHLVDLLFVEFNVRNSEIKNVLLGQEVTLCCQHREFRHSILILCSLAQSKLLKIVGSQDFLGWWQLLLEFHDLCIS